MFDEFSKLAKFILIDAPVCLIFGDLWITLIVAKDYL
jgi:hypothetical protein